MSSIMSAGRSLKGPIVAIAAVSAWGLYAQKIQCMKQVYYLSIIRLDSKSSGRPSALVEH